MGLVSLDLQLGAFVGLAISHFLIQAFSQLWDFHHLHHRKLSHFRVLDTNL